MRFVRGLCDYPISSYWKTCIHDVKWSWIILSMVMVENSIGVIKDDDLFLEMAISSCLDKSLCWIISNSHLLCFTIHLFWSIWHLTSMHFKVVSRDAGLKSCVHMHQNKCQFVSGHVGCMRSLFISLLKNVKKEITFPLLASWPESLQSRDKKHWQKVYIACGSRPDEL